MTYCSIQTNGDEKVSFVINEAGDAWLYIGKDFPICLRGNLPADVVNAIRNAYPLTEPDPGSGDEGTAADDEALESEAT